jgi:hypothetical protein
MDNNPEQYTYKTYGMAKAYDNDGNETPVTEELRERDRKALLKSMRPTMDTEK